MSTLATLLVSSIPVAMPKRDLNEDVQKALTEGKNCVSEKFSTAGQITCLDRKGFKGSSGIFNKEVDDSTITCETNIDGGKCHVDDVNKKKPLHNLSLSHTENISDDTKSSYQRAMQPEKDKADSFCLYQRDGTKYRGDVVHYELEGSSKLGHAQINGRCKDELFEMAGDMPDSPEALLDHNDINHKHEKQEEVKPQANYRPSNDDNYQLAA